MYFLYICCLLLVCLTISYHRLSGVQRCFEVRYLELFLVALILENARVTNCSFDFLVHLHYEGHSPEGAAGTRGSTFSGDFSPRWLQKSYSPVLAAGMQGGSLLGPLRTQKSKTATPLQGGRRNAGEQPPPPPPRSFQPPWLKKIYSP